MNDVGGEGFAGAPGTPSEARPGRWNAAPWTAARVALAYAVAGIAWILLSGWAAGLIGHDATRARVESLKGTAFILVTSGLLWVLLQRYLGRLQESAGRLARSEAEYQQLVQSVPVIVWTGDAHGRIDYLNRRGRAYFGEERIAPGGFAWNEYVHPDEREEVERAHDEALAKGRDARITFRLRDAAGNYRWFEARTAAIRGARGEPVRFFGTLADVHEAMVARMALRRGQEQLARVADTIPPGMMILSFQRRPDGKSLIPYASAGIADVFGVSADDVAEDASIISEWTPAEDRAAVSASIAASAEALTPWRCQFRYVHPTRGELWLEGHSMPLREADGSTTWHGVMMDITERRRIEDELRTTQSRLVAALDGAGIGTWIWDAGSRSLNIDAGVGRLWGLPAGRTRVTSEELGRVIHPDDVAATQLAIRDAFEGRSNTLAVTFRVRRPGGTGWVSLTGRREAADGHDRLVGAAVDVTEFKQVQEALRASEERFSRAFHDSPLGQVIVRTRDRRIIEVNEAYLRLLGYTREEMIGQVAEQVSPPIGEGELRAAWERMQSERSVADVLYRFERRDGTPRAALFSAESIELGGEPHWLIALNDVTDRRATEDALRESEERFRELAESIREVFWLTEPDGRMLYVSPAYEAIWGADADALYTSRDAWLASIHPDDRAAVAAAPRLQADGSYDQEYRIVRADGEIRWIRDRAFPVTGRNGEVVRVAGVAEDVTDRRSLEEQVRQTQKMESVGELAGGVAHDFNNWLTVIQSYSDLLLEELPPDGEVREYVQEIQAASERAASLTRQLLAFSRREIIERRVVEVNAIVLDTEKMLRRLLGEDVEVRTRLSQGLPRVHADPGQLVQVLMNLAVNARDAMPRGGTLTVATNEARPDDSAPGQRWVEVRVSDTGTGIAADVVTRIFEPFFTTKGVGKGTGLGLSVVHGIVQQAGGRITVQSRPGEGTTFTVLLPGIEQAAGQAQAGSEGSSQLAGTETILLAEDEESIRRLVARGLRRYGYTVLTAADGEEALSLLNERGREIDLLVTDVVMPRLDGQGLADALRREAPHVRILFSSGYTDDAILRYGVLHAEVAFLQKPYTVEALGHKIRQILDAR
ncbi:MAG: PAS domain S-box protein [Dehalococcoidia bacterium]|nr:PAS domain S-box protein [Dehalococcoidia bacterium]